MASSRRTWSGSPHRRANRLKSADV
jgi:hypothetical protein